jgi:hypothetical protein
MDNWQSWEQCFLCRPRSNSVQWVVQGGTGHRGRGALVIVPGPFVPQIARHFLRCNRGGRAPRRARGIPSLAAGPLRMVRSLQRGPILARGLVWGALRIAQLAAAAHASPS